MSQGTDREPVASVLAELLGDSAGIRALRDQVERLLRRQAEGARRLAPILILGETGTGKGLLAGLLHRAGPRAGGPFVDVNCAAIPEALLEAELFGFERGAFTDARQAKAGLLQTAHRGVLFLDEVGLLPEGLQAKLLKVLEERSVRRLGSTRREPLDVWIVAATSEDLPSAVRARRFREDLYHRLTVLTLRLPPLRERGDDIVRLAEHFLRHACQDYGLASRVLAPDARAALLAHAWPGNVRELGNVMERVTLLADATTVTAEMLDLPSAQRPPGSAASPEDERRVALEAEAQAERLRLLEALRATKWNLSRAAARLGIPRNTLRYRAERLGLGRDRTAARPEARTPDVPARSGESGGGVPVSPAADQPSTASVHWEPCRVALLRVRLGGDPAGPGSAEGSRLMEIVLDKVRSFGGSIDEIGPTGIVAVFGLTALEDAPRRAAYAALAVQRVFTARRAAASWSTLGLALHAERLPVARLPDGREIDADARRRVRGLLDTLVDRAEDGAILLSAPAAALLAHRFELRPIGVEPGLPGDVHRLGGATAAVRDVGLVVGRGAELHLLGERLGQARAGRGQVVSIVGEPGIGKSRLLREFRRQVSGGVPWLEGQAMPFGRPMPFHPLIDMLRRACGIVEGDEGAAATGRLEGYVLGLGEDLRPTLPFLRDLLALDPDEPARNEMDPGVRRAGILDAVRRLLLRVAERGAAILVFEDVHWADQTTLGFLADLADTLATRSVLMLLTARAGYPWPLGEQSFHTRLPLAALSVPDSLEVARRQLGVETLPQGVESLIAGKAAGNPFFVEEVVRMLQDLHLLRRTDAGWALVEPPGQIALPDTVQEVVLARVDRLEAAAKQILDVASIIGSDVPVLLLQRLVHLSPEGFRQGLQDLRASELLLEAGTVPGQDYTFKHAVIQEVVYGQVPAARRRDLHGSVVDAIERVHGDRLGEHVDRLAYHASRGERWEQALDYARQAAVRARAQSAYREMAAFLEQAVGVLEHLPRSAFALQQGVDLRFELRDAYNALREPDRVIGWLREAETLARALADPRRVARVASYLSQYFWSEGKHDAAIEAGRRALEGARALGDLGLQVATAFYLGRVHHAVGDYDRAIRELRWSTTALEGGLAHHRYGVAGLPSVLSRIWLAWCHAELGRFGEAVACGDEALQLAAEGSDSFTQVGAYLASARAHWRQGDVDRAIAGLGQSLGLARAWDIPVWVPIVSAELGAAYLQSGRIPEAIRSLDLALTTPWKVDVALWTAWVGEAHLRAGRLEEARHHADRALLLARGYGERGNEAHVCWLQGAIAAAREEPGDEAIRYFRRSLDIAEALGMRPLVAHCHAGLGRASRRGHGGALAERHLATASSLYEELGMVPRSGLGEARPSTVQESGTGS